MWKNIGCLANYESFLIVRKSLLGKLMNKSLANWDLEGSLHTGIFHINFQGESSLEIRRNPGELSQRALSFSGLWLSLFDQNNFGEASCTDIARREKPTFSSAT